MVAQGSMVIVTLSKLNYGSSEGSSFAMQGEGEEEAKL